MIHDLTMAMSVRARRFACAVDWYLPIRPSTGAIPLACFFALTTPSAFAQEPLALFQPVEAPETTLAEPQQDLLSDIRAEPTTASVRLVRIPTGILQSKTLRIEPTAEQDFLADRTTEEASGMQDTAWIGKITNEPGEVVLIVNGDQVTGNIHAGSDLFQIQPLGNGLHAVIEVNQNAFPEEHPPEFEEIERQGSAMDPSNLEEMDAAEQDQANQIDVLVAYTPTVAARVADINSFIALAIAENNLANLNSGVNIRINLVDSFQTNYNESGNFSTDVERFRTPGDGHMDEVHNRRDESAADLAVLIMNNGQYCGLASGILATQDLGFAGVHYTCATGNYSFAHELGHLQGARHNPEADPSTTPFSYGHGFYREAQHDRSVMSYDCPVNCTRIPYWSNPNVNHNGALIGTATTHDNARVLNRTSGTIAAFRSRGGSGDDVADIIWQHINGQVHYWPMRGGKRQGGSTSQA